MHHSSVSSLAVKGLVLAASLAASTWAQAETSPYYIGISQAFKSDSNIRKAPDGAEQSDVISSTGLLAGLDQPFSRQRLRATLSTNYNRYSDHSEYNNTDYDLRGALDWETIERLSGTLSVGSRQSLYQDTSLTSSGRNTLRIDNAAFVARLGVVTMWSFDAGVSTQRNKYSNAAYAGSNLRQHSYDGGVTYRPTPDWNVRLGLRRTEGSYFDRTVGNEDDIKRNDIEVSSFLRLTGESTLNARLAHTNETHTSTRVNDINGFTGSLGWDWAVTGKTSLGVSLSRDTSVGGRDDPSLPVSIYADADSVMRNVLSLRGTWQPTGKIRFNANLAYAQRTLEGGGVVTSTDDSTQSASLQMTYSILRNVDLGCGLTHEERDASKLTSQSYSYKVNTVSCFGQAYLR